MENGLSISQKEVLLLAIQQLGYSEQPPDSNMQRYGEWYGMNGVPWCAMFVSWVFFITGLPLGRIDDDKGYRYCPSALAFFKKNNWVTDNPQAGDIVIFDWQLDGKPDHTGIFLQWKASDHQSIITIEGNTAVGNDSNGGSVMLRVRDRKFCTFVHPPVLDM